MSRRDRYIKEVSGGGYSVVGMEFVAFSCDVVLGWPLSCFQEMFYLLPRRVVRDDGELVSAIGSVIVLARKAAFRCTS